jgi:hypothetical protein
MMRPIKLVWGAAFLTLAGCASIVEGTSQEVSMQISPDTAVCKLSQKGNVIATIDDGGGPVQIPKSKDAVSVECTAVGYEKQVMSIDSSASGWGIVGCFLIDLCVTDYSTGALNKYPTSINVRLHKADVAQASANSPSTAEQPSNAEK